MSGFPDIIQLVSWTDFERSVQQGARARNGLKVPDATWERWFPGGRISPAQLKVLSKSGLLQVMEQGNDSHILHWISGRGDVQSVQGLLDAGMNPSHVGNFNYTPLMSALDGRGQDGLSWGVGWEVAELLLKKGADPNANGLGATPRPFFTFLSSLPWIVHQGGQEAMDRVWTAFDEAGVDYSLNHDDQTPIPINYYMLGFIQLYAIHPAPGNTSELYLSAMLRLASKGVNFSPSYRYSGLGRLGEYAKRYEPASVELLEQFKAQKTAMRQAASLEKSTPKKSGALKRPRF